MLIFDFDGVLMDSVREIAVTTYNMLKGTIVTRLDQLPQEALDLFLSNRFHVQPIGDAPVLMEWCLETDESDPQILLSKKEYDDIIRHIDEPVTVRTTRFFDTRARFKARNFKAWIALNKPVQPLWDRLIERRSSDLVMFTIKIVKPPWPFAIILDFQSTMPTSTRAITARLKSTTCNRSGNGSRIATMRSSMIPLKILAK